MSVFTVDLANQPGELARLCEAMAGRGINLVLSAIAREDGGTVAFIADDEAGAQEVLDGAGLQYAMRPALTIRMENQPGTGAATFRKLANAGVNAGDDDSINLSGLKIDLAQTAPSAHGN